MKEAMEHWNKIAGSLSPWEKADWANKYAAQLLSENEQMSQALRALPVYDGWEDIATLPDNLPIGTNALFWGVAHVSGSWLEDEQRYQRWITEQKIFKWAYVGRDHGRGPNGSANLENWYEPSSNGACRVEKLEATKWRPLPAPPSE